MTRNSIVAQTESAAGERHQPRNISTAADTFGHQWQLLREAEDKLHNLQAAHDRAQQKARECSRRWEVLMLGGDGRVTAEAEEVDTAITQATGQAARLAPLIEAQAVEVLRLRIPARKAAFAYRESHRQSCADVAAAALDELLLAILPQVVAQPVRQVIGLYQLAGMSTDDISRRIADAVRKLADGEHQDTARTAIRQNAGGNLASFPAPLPVEVTRALRHAPSPVQDSMMKNSPEYELRLALGQEKLKGISHN